MERAYWGGDWADRVAVHEQGIRCAKWNPWDRRIGHGCFVDDRGGLRQHFGTLISSRSLACVISLSSFFLHGCIVVRNEELTATLFSSATAPIALKRSQLTIRHRGLLRRCTRTHASKASYQLLHLSLHYQDANFEFRSAEQYIRKASSSLSAHWLGVRGVQRYLRSRRIVDVISPRFR